MDSLMCPTMANVLNTWMLKFVNMSVYHNLPKNKCKYSSIADPLLFSYYLASDDKFSILKLENKRFFLKLKDNEI